VARVPLERHPGLYGTFPGASRGARSHELVITRHLPGTGAVAVDHGDVSDRNRREHPRAAADTTAVVLARHNQGVPVMIASISLGGARLVGEITVAIGERVQILFEIDQQPLELEAEVVRVEMVDMATDHIAVRFVTTAEGAKRLIRGLVERSLDNDSS
jgi:hypothetical protein